MPAAHPFWVGGDWRPAGELQAGDVLTTPGGGSAVLERVVRRPGECTVHNLAVAGPETYYAGGVLVHNKSRRNTSAPETPEMANARGR